MSFYINTNKSRLLKNWCSAIYGPQQHWDIWLLSVAPRKVGEYAPLGHGRITNMIITTFALLVLKTIAKYKMQEPRRSKFKLFISTWYSRKEKM